MENQTLTRQELYELIWSNPFTTLAKKYLISDNGLRKICVRMNIPLPKGGHWVKLQFNKSVTKTKLPTNYSGEREVILTLRQESDISMSTPSPLIAMQKQILAEEGEKISVPVKLTNPHKLIIAARESLTKKGRNISYRDGLVSTSLDDIRISVTPENISRALRFMDIFIKTITKRGFTVSMEHHKTVLLIHNEKIEFYLKEKLNRIEKESKYSWKEYDFVPTGLLALIVKVSWQSIEWKDGKLPLENQLSKIIAWLIIRGEKLRQYRIELEKGWAEQAERRRIEEEKKIFKDLELKKIKRLLKDAKRWREVELLRNYLSDFETKVKANNDMTEEFKDWLLWARKKVDWYDPQIALKDEFLSEKDLNNLEPENK